MILPYVYYRWDDAERVVMHLHNMIGKYEHISVNSLHEFVNELFWLRKPYTPEWMEGYEYEYRYTNECYGWLKDDFHVYIKDMKWYGGSGYVLELPEPILFERYQVVTNN